MFSLEIKCPWLVYFDQLSGATHTQKPVKILFWPFSAVFLLFSSFFLLFRQNKTGLQAVSKPVEQEVGFLRTLKRGELSYKNVPTTFVKSLVCKGTRYACKKGLSVSLEVWAEETYSWGNCTNNINTEPILTKLL